MVIFPLTFIFLKSEKFINYEILTLIMNSEKILIVSDSPLGTSGFSTVSYNLSKIFHKLGYDVFVMGFNHVGNPIKTDHFVVFQAGMPYNNQYGYFTFDHYVKKIRPNLIVSIADLHQVKYIKEKKGDIKWLAYFPVDTDDWSKELRSYLHFPDYLVPYSNFGKKMVLSEGLTPLDMIYHGVDLDIFHPIDNARSYLLDIPEDSFIVGTVATLNKRKMWNVWFEVVDKFLKDKDDAYVVAMVDPKHIFGDVYNFNETRLAKNLESKVLTPSEYNTQAGGLTPPEINIYYNIFDCHLLTTGGEGFGLPILESMAAGTPNVVSDYSACPEIVGTSGMLIPVSRYVKIHKTRRPIIDVDIAVDHLNTLYENANYLDLLSQRALKRAKQFTWEKTIPQWKKALEVAINGEK